MESEKVKEIKKGLSKEEIIEILKKRIENINPWETHALEYHKGLLDLINELESENEKLESENYKLEQNLGQCENGYELELHTARCQVHFMEETVEKLKKENELLRNAKVVYETVDYCYEDLKKAEKRIAELEKEIEVNAFYSKGYAQGIKNTYEVVIPDKLKQFAERMKDMPFDIEFTFKESSYEDIKKLANVMREYSVKYIDETLKEIINES